MSNQVIIKVENLCKNFKLYTRPKHRLLEALHPLRKTYHHEFHALKDVSFEINKGESIGILGKNGAGKSTLLKILTGVLTPTSGSVEVNGRVAALLELGSGFNPELSGLENIYFQGAIIGFAKNEMENKVKEIVDFADIGEFIDQPVKTYSSGMFARLAFSIAINIDPEILIVDEALGVGDIKFQQKCIMKMKEFFGKKTVLFVSHDLLQVKNFCSKAMWFENGQLVSFADTATVCEEYYSWMVYGHKTNRATSATLALLELNSEYDLESVAGASSFGEMKATINSVGLFAENGKVSSTHWGERVKLVASINNPSKIENLGLGIMLQDNLGREIFTINSYIIPVTIPSGFEKSLGIIEFEIPRIQPGEYVLIVALSEGTLEKHVQHHWLHNSITLKIDADTVLGTLGCLLMLPLEKTFINVRKIK